MVTRKSATYYTYYNKTENQFCDEDGYLIDLDGAYLYPEHEKELAIKDIECFDSPEQWKVLGVKVHYETFEI